MQAALSRCLDPSPRALRKDREGDILMEEKIRIKGKFEKDKIAVRLWCVAALCCAFSLIRGVMFLPIA